MEQRVTIVIFILLLEAVAMAFTAFGCWLSRKCRRRAGWYLGFFGAIGAAALAIFFIYGSLLFQFDRLEQSARAGKTSVEEIILWFLIFTGMAIIPALLLVQRCRKRFTDHIHAS